MELAAYLFHELRNDANATVSSPLFHTSHTQRIQCPRPLRNHRHRRSPNSSQVGVFDSLVDQSGSEEVHLPPALLEQLYDNILRDEIKIEQREFIHAAKSEGWLLKRGGKVKTWKRRCASFAVRRPRSRRVTAARPSRDRRATADTV